MPDELLAEVRSTAELTGLSQQDIMRQSIKAGIGKVREAFATSAGRVTNVEPLPEAVLRKCYTRPERDEAAVDRLIKRQAKGVRD